MRKCLLYLVGFTCSLSLFAQQPLKGRDTTVGGPQTFAIILGISKYKYVRPLSYADKDAELFRDFLRSPSGGNLKDDNIFCLLNDQALHSTFWSKGFQWLRAKKLQRGDRLFIYLAGHGDAIDEDQYFFLGYDCNPAGDKNNYLVGGAIQLFNLKKKIAVETGKGVDVFLVMDACRSNELPGGIQGQNFLNQAISEKKAGEIMMLSTAAGQESLEDISIGNGHGLFTWYLVDGLSGLADSEGSKDNIVTLSEIRNYVDRNVLSISEQQFRKKQDPYFCCDEFSQKVVSRVDPAYLQKWMNQKKNRRGNAFDEDLPPRPFADTLLLETYRRFNRAVSDNQLAGNQSAEDYYRQLDKKFPGNPYTLDAKTTLAAAYINDAQKRVNNYLACGLVSGSKEKQENAQAGSRLESAIQLLLDEDPDFAVSLRARMFFLKSTGDYGTTMTAFDLAHAARSIDRNAAYIDSWLARLHFENKRRDSAEYYATKAATEAPNWPCIATLLSLVRNNNTPDQPKPDGKNKPALTKSIGFFLGTGSNSSQPDFTANPNSDVLSIRSSGKAGFQLGGIYQIGISNKLDIRPAVFISVENSEVIFERRGTPGPIQDVIEFKNVAVNISVPLIIHFSTNRTAPFFSLGPTLGFVVSEDEQSASRVPMKKSVVMGQVGAGVDIMLGNKGWILSPEISYTRGFTDMHENAGNLYTASMSGLKRQAFMFNFYLRKR
jgi:hypothetical protein